MQRRGGRLRLQIREVGVKLLSRMFRVNGPFWQLSRRGGKVERAALGYGMFLALSTGSRWWDVIRETELTRGLGRGRAIYIDWYCA